MVTEENAQCLPPTVSFTTENVERKVKIFNNVEDADKWLLSQKEDAVTKSNEVKKDKSLIKKCLRNTLCKINDHNIYAYANNGVCLNCGKIVPLNNVMNNVICEREE